MNKTTSKWLVFAGLKIAEILGVIILIKILGLIGGLVIGKSMVVGESNIAFYIAKICMGGIILIGAGTLIVFVGFIILVWINKNLELAEKLSEDKK